MQTANVINDFVNNFTAIVWEALPFIILGALIAGILEELLPQQAIGKRLPRHFLPAILAAGLLGLVFPMCECGIVVVMRRLLRKGLPLSCCVTYMLAGPILNVVVIMSTWYAFEKHRVGVEQTTSLGPYMLLLRCGMGYIVACTTGIIVHFVDKRSKTGLVTISMPSASEADSVENSPKRRKPTIERLNHISSTAMNDFLDITVFLIIGSLLASLLRADPSLIRNVELLSQQQPLLAIPAMMALAVGLCLCSEADAFLAASFTGMSVSAKVAFLVLGPMLDLKLLMLYTRVFRARLIITLVTCSVLQVGIYSVLLHHVWNPYVPGTVLDQRPESPTSQDPAGGVAKPVLPAPATSPSTGGR